MSNFFGGSTDSEMEEDNFIFANLNSKNEVITEGKMTGEQRKNKFNEIPKTSNKKYSNSVQRIFSPKS